MKLNGWQRLWVVVAAVWMLPVLVFSYQLWPTTHDIPKADVYARMKSDDGRRLIDYYDVLAAARYGLTPAPQFSIEPPKSQTPETKPRGQYTAADIDQPKATGEKGNSQPLRLPPERRWYRSLRILDRCRATKGQSWTLMATRLNL